MKIKRQQDTLTLLPERTDSMDFITPSVYAEAETPADEAASDCLVTQTPFHLGDGWEFVTDNTNSSCSHAEIETLIQKRILNLIDLEIMKVLAACHYLNHRNLAEALRLRLHSGYQKTSYLDNIRKLKKAGILLSYRPIRKEDLAAGADASPASPVRLYCLSNRAFTYIERITPDAHPILPSSARRKMELAATGQFLIHFKAHYGQQVVGIEYQKGTRLGNALFLLDALIRYHTVFLGQQAPSLVTLLLLSVRRQKGWEKDALSRLHLLGVWLSRHEMECLLPLPILLVEDIAMAISLYAKMHGMESLLGFTVYFCPDSLLMVYSPLQALYRCEVTEDGKVTAVRVKLENS